MAHAMLRNSKDQTSKYKSILLVTEDREKKQKHVAIPACDISFNSEENEGFKFSVIASLREMIGLSLLLLLRR